MSWLAGGHTEPQIDQPDFHVLGTIPSAWRPVMVLSGLRGALSLALVLGLPAELEQRNLLTDIVYGVILVTLLGQGLTLRVLLPRWKEKLVRAEVEKPGSTQA